MAHRVYCREIVRDYCQGQKMAKKSFEMRAATKLYIPSIINTRMKLSSDLGRQKNSLVSGRLACTSNNPQFLRIIPIEIISLNFLSVPEHMLSIYIT